jgi:Arc/MetJ-type ribon-helix-helix transcriptional regulator
MRDDPMSDERLTLAVPAYLARAVATAVEAGEYASVEHALEDALERWSRRHEDAEEAQAELEVMIAASIHDPRPSLTLAEVDARLDAFFRNVEASRSAEAA